MVLIIPAVLEPANARGLAAALANADWVDGNVTSGAGAALAKRNRQLPETGEAAQNARAQILNALAHAPLFLSAALPRRIYPPLFNAYGVGDGFGEHVDNAVRIDPGTGSQMRTDLSATLFLTDPADYDGGELVMESDRDGRSYKLAAGDMVLYSASTLHRVEPLTRGERIACFFWVESLVRDETARETLFDLDQSVQNLSVERGGADAEVLRLTKVYHNLVRRWAG